jgi:hypothetical protein
VADRDPLTVSEPAGSRRPAAQALPFWPHAVAVAAALLALGYATGRVRAPATPPEPTVSVPERRAAPAPEPQAPAPPEPQLNVPIFELRPDASAAAGQRIEWPGFAPLATFVLGLGQEPARDEYALRVRTQDGALVLSAEGLKRTGSATLTLAVPRRMMPPGRYVFELLLPGSKPEADALRSYAIEVR